MTASPSILIIAFYYPPYPKVGSRRWVKFAKYLNRHKKKVHVLAAKMDIDKKSPWDNDAAEIEHITTRLNFKYHLPYFKTEIPKTFISKVRWQISKHLNSGSNKNLPGSPFDDSEKYAAAFLKATKKIIEEKQIDTIIFTASPNHLAYHISTLKNEYKDIKFIFDLRDYWSDWMQHFERPKLEYEMKLENDTVLNSDLVLSPAARIVETLALRYAKKPIKVLPHAYDDDDFDLSADHQVSPVNDRTINLVYAGSMYENMERNMELLAELAESNDRIQLTFYVFTEDYKKFFASEKIKDRVIYLKPLTIKEFTKKMQNEADALIYMRSTLSNDSDFLSSKFFDFLPLRKPIVYLGDRGDALDFIEKQKIGFHLMKDSITNFENLLETTNKTICNFDIKPYSFEYVTRQLEKEIES